MDTPCFTGARSHAFCDNKGRCLNFHGTDHSLKHCSRPFTNGSGCLNPRLGKFGYDGGLPPLATAYTLIQSSRQTVGGGNTHTSQFSHRRNTSSRQFDHNSRNGQGDRPHDPSRHNLRHNGRGNIYIYISRPDASLHDNGRYPSLQIGQNDRNPRNSP